MKNFEYMRSDLDLSPEPNELSTSSTTHYKSSDGNHQKHAFPPLNPKTQQLYRCSDYVTVPSKQHQQHCQLNDPISTPSVVVAHSASSVITLPTCCLKTIAASATKQNGGIGGGISEVNSGGVTIKQQQINPVMHETLPITLVPRSSSGILNFQLKNIKQTILSNNKKSTSKNESSTGTNNSFTFSNFFKSSDKSSSTISPQREHATFGGSSESMPLKPQPSPSSSTCVHSSLIAPMSVLTTALPKNYIANTGSALQENVKGDEFLKATMKICLVVSPPSNKLQVFISFHFYFCNDNLMINFIFI